MRYAVVGAGGQLGQALCRRLGDQAIPLDRSRLDITQPILVRDRLAEVQPEVVLNCAAYNAVDRAEAEVEKAFGVNAIGVRNLAQACAELDCLFIHFSTNYVFGLDAGRIHPYLEDDLPGPLSIYGVSKLAGEYFAQAAAPNLLVLRTSAVFGPAPRNFVHQMLSRAERGEAIRVVDDQTCTPTFVEDLATATLHLVEQRSRGLFHVACAGSCTWFEFALTIFELARIKADLEPISSKTLGAAAVRPTYSVIENLPQKGSQLPPRRPWQEALEEHLRFRSP